MIKKCINQHNQRLVILLISTATYLLTFVALCVFSSQAAHASQIAATYHKGPGGRIIVEEASMDDLKQARQDADKNKQSQTDTDSKTFISTWTPWLIGGGVALVLVLIGSLVWRLKKRRDPLS